MHHSQLFWTLRLSFVSEIWLQREVMRTRNPCISILISYGFSSILSLQGYSTWGRTACSGDLPEFDGLRVGAVLLRCIRGLLVLIRPLAREHRTTASKVRYTSMADVKMSACSGGPGPRAWKGENELQNKEPFQCLIRTSWYLLVYHSNGEYTAMYCK